MSLSPSEVLTSFKSRFDGLRGAAGPLALAGTGAQSDTPVFAKHGSMIEAKGPAITPHYSLQEKLRPAFGKGAPREVTVGNHPDFAYLADTDGTEDCPIVTLFMDIESSTRLGLFYSPAQVARIKNAFLCTAIELAHTFDGHVHRLQGDSVMVFFGGRDARAENAAVDAINCAAALWLFVKSTVIPSLEREGYDEDFGIRIGVDYAPDAHWRWFGFPGVGEVTATAFGVDAAAKLQQNAGRNQIMLGQRLVECLDLPDVVTRPKYIRRAGADVAEPFLVPNITLPDGTPNNYRKARLAAEEYLRCGPLAEVAAELIGDRRLQPLRLSMTVHKERDGGTIAGYSAASLVLPKEHWIRFALSLPFQPRLPYTVTYAVENHGQQARDDAGDGRGDHSTERVVTSSGQHAHFVHWERTAYRGLHYMIITVSNASGVVARRRVGVFIE